MGVVTHAHATVAQDLGEIVVTATRIAQSDYKIASNVSVITRNQISETNAQNVSDVLKEVVGVHVYDKNTAKTSTVDIRGFGDTATRNVLVLINDRKINLADMSGADLMQVPLDAIERIEIVRGAGSVLYGDNAVGGVINIITKKGEGNFSGKIGTKYSSYDAQGADFEVSGEQNQFSYYLYSKYDDQRGYRQNSDVLSKDFMTRLGYDFGKALDIDFTAGYHNDTYDLPGGLDEAELLSLGREGSANNNDVATTKDQYYQLSLDVDPWRDDVEFGHLVVDVTYRDREMFDSFSGWDTDRDINTTGVTAKYIFDQMLFDRDVNFVTGVDFYDTQNDIVGSGSNTDDLVISKEELGVYSSLQFELIDNIFINGGTRFQKADYAFSKHDVFYDSKQSPEEWVSMGGMRYDYGNHSNMYFSVQQTFRFLSTDEWYSSWSGLNTNLSQQTGIQYEVGVKHHFDDVLLLNVTPYWIENKDEIYYEPNSGYFGSNNNYDKTRRIGVEFGSRLDLLKLIEIAKFDRFDFLTNYTYQNPQFIEGVNDGKNIPLVPVHQASFGMAARFFEYFNVSLFGKYVGSRFIINDTLNEMPQAKPYFVVDGNLSYKRKDWEVFFELNNIFNEKYASYQVKKTATTRDIFPDPERNFSVGVNYRF